MRNQMLVVGCVVQGCAALLYAVLCWAELGWIIKRNQIWHGAVLCCAVKIWHAAAVLATSGVLAVLCYHVQATEQQCSHDRLALQEHSQRSDLYQQRRSNDVWNILSC